jgi:hypothetical protein
VLGSPPDELSGSKPWTWTGSLPPIGWLEGSVAGASWPLGESCAEDGAGVSGKVPWPAWVAGSAFVLVLLGSVLVWCWADAL